MYHIVLKTSYLVTGVCIENYNILNERLISKRKNSYEI